MTAMTKTLGNVTSNDSLETQNTKQDEIFSPSTEFMTKNIEISKLRVENRKLKKKLLESEGKVKVLEDKVLEFQLSNAESAETKLVLKFFSFFFGGC